MNQTNDNQEKKWIMFLKVRRFTKGSERPKLVLQNNICVALELCDVGINGELQTCLHADHQEVVKFSKSEGQQCFFFIVRECQSQKFRAAFIGNYSQMQLVYVIGANYVEYRGSDWSFDHKCNILWPVRSHKSFNPVRVIIENKRNENSFCVNRVNERGREEMFVEKVSKKSK